MPPAQNGPPGRSGDRASVASVTGSTRSTHDVVFSHGCVLPWTNTSPGARSTTMFANGIVRAVTASASPG